jgi:uncharacterized protein YbaA (DUF1428 family)
MLISQWHLDVPYGEQSEAPAAVRARGAEKFASSYRALGSRPG